MAVLPQDSVYLRDCLPPDADEIKACICAMFLRSEVVPNRDNIKNLHPMMVTKTIVSAIIHFLLENNPWYHASGVQFSPENVDALYDKSKTDDCQSAVPAAVEMCNLPD